MHRKPKHFEHHAHLEQYRSAEERYMYKDRDMREQLSGKVGRLLGQTMKVPDGMSEEDAAKYREVMTVVSNEGSGFIEAAVEHAIHSPEFMKQLRDRARQAGIHGAASNLASSEVVLENPDRELMRRIMELPPEHIHSLAAAASELQKRKISVTPDSVREVFEQAVVYRVMEIERQETIGEVISESMASEAVDSYSSVRGYSPR